MGNKRKGDNAEVSLLSASQNRAVVFSPRDPNASLFLSSTATTAKETACKQKLQSILQLVQSHSQSSDSDPVLSSLLQATALRDHWHPQRVAEQRDAAATAQLQLSQQISAARSHVQQQQQAATARHAQWQALRQQTDARKSERMQLLQQMQPLLQQMEQLRVPKRVRNVATAAASEQDGGVPQQQRRLQVPRLQYQISLFANITGIKWDFAAQERLAEQEDGGNTCRLIGLVVRGVL